jgi:hypothetical protein
MDAIIVVDMQAGVLNDAPTCMAVIAGANHAPQRHPASARRSRP